MKYDARVEGKARHIVHMIQENEGIHLSDKSLGDIYFTVRATADYWKKDSDKIREENAQLQLNELNIWINRNPEATAQDILNVMAMLKNKEHVRNYRIEKKLHKVVDTHKLYEVV